MEMLERLWLMGLQGCVVILFVMAVRMFLKRYPKGLSYCLWALVGVRLLCPVFVESKFSLQPEFVSLREMNFRQDFHENLTGQENVESQGAVLGEMLTGKWFTADRRVECRR